jgi:hypothetical protein
VKHKLEFVKISNEHLFAGVGFGGNIFIVLNSLTNISDDDLLVVDMETNECVCTQPDLKDYNTNNCWEYYFDQPTIKSDEPFNRTNSLVSGKIGYGHGDSFLYPENFIELKNKISTLQIQVQNLEGVVFAPEKIYITLKNAESLEYFDFPMAPEKIKSKNFSLKIGSKLHEDFFKYSEKYGINKVDIVDSYIYHLVNKLKNKSIENDETKR